MDPEFLLSVIAAIAVFFLKSTLAFTVCVALSRLAHSPKLRFVVWSGFVYGAAAYWLYLASALFHPARHLAAAVPLASPPLISSAGVWQIPSLWASPLSVAFRAIGIVYLLVLCYSTFAHLKKHRYLKWVLSFTSEPPAKIAEIFQSVARELHDSRSRIFILAGATSPVTFGWARPIVLLPSSCIEDDRCELEDILRHELHHVARWDAIWHELAVAARGLLFFHPAAWYSLRKMQFERELACDLAVVARCPARRAAYAECLVRFARLNAVPESSGWGIDFAASAHHLPARVHSILAASKSSPSWTRYLRIASGLTIFAIFLVAAPSLAILFSFTYQQVSNLPSPSMNRTRPTEPQHKTKVSRKGYTLPSVGKESRPVEAITPIASNDDPSEMTVRSGISPQTLSSQDSSGPQLRRRGGPSASGEKGAVSQTIALADANSTAEERKGDRKQAIQQTATVALGIYKRIASVDRH